MRITPGSNSTPDRWLAGAQLIDVMMLSQSYGVHMMSQFMLKNRPVRIDFDLPDSSWSLDNAAYIDRLTHIGYESAHAAIAGLRETFFARSTEPYKPAQVA